MDQKQYQTISVNLKVWIIKDFIKSEFKLNDEDDDHKFVWPILLPHIFCADSLPAQRNIVMSLMKLLLMRNLFRSEEDETASARSHLTCWWNPSFLGWYWAGTLTKAKMVTYITCSATLSDQLVTCPLWPTNSVLQIFKYIFEYSNICYQILDILIKILKF